MSFRDILKSGKFLITIDTIPPKGTELSGNLRRLEGLKGRVDGVNVVDMPSAVMRMSPLPVCHLLKEEGFGVSGSLFPKLAEQTAPAIHVSRSIENRHSGSIGTLSSE